MHIINTVLHLWVLSKDPVKNWKEPNKKAIKKELEIRGRIETIQTTAMLRSDRILRRVLETRGVLLSFRLLWKTTSLCWCEKLLLLLLLLRLLLLVIIIIIPDYNINTGLNPICRLCEQKIESNDLLASDCSII